MNNLNQENIQEPLKDQTKNETAQETTNTTVSNDTVEDKNWAAVREQRKLERKAREEAERRAAEKAAEAEALKAALEALANKPTQHYRDEHQEETEDEKIKRRVEEIIKEREKTFYKEQEEKERIEFPNRLRQTHPDFDKICDAENLDYLEYHHPEIVEPFKHMPDGFKKWDALYKVAKKLLPNPNIKQDQKRMEQNLKKPGSISSVGTTQGVGIAPPTRLTEAQRAANWERMQRTLKGLS